MRRHLVVSEETLEKLKNCPPSRLYWVVMSAAIELGITDRAINCSGDDRDEFHSVWEACLNRLDKQYAGWRGYWVTLRNGTKV